MLHAGRHDEAHAREVGGAHPGVAGERAFGRGVRGWEGLRAGEPSMGGLSAPAREAVGSEHRIAFGPEGITTPTTCGELAGAAE